MQLEGGDDEGVGRGGNAEFLAQARDRAGEPGQLEAAAALQVLEHRGFHLVGQPVAAGEGAIHEVVGQTDALGASDSVSFIEPGA